MDNVVLKEQAQNFINDLMKGQTNLGENFSKWADENEGVELVIRTKQDNGKDEVSCYEICELSTMLDLEAKENIVEGFISEETGCDECPWSDDCTL